MRVQVVALVLLGLLAVHALASCPKNCSGRGTCSGTVCICDAGWDGDDCSIHDELLTAGGPVSGYLDSWSWDYYHIDVPAGTTGFRVTVMQTSRYGDVDLYLQRGHRPSQHDFYDKDISTKSEMVMEVADPDVGTWYVGLYGYFHVDYTIQLEMTTGCTVDCHNGHCVGTTCSCDDYWTGDDCSIFDKPLQDNEHYHGDVATGEWAYFHFEGTAGYKAIVNVASDEGIDVDLYLNPKTRPSFFDFFVNEASQDSVFSLDVDITESLEGTWYIGVYGYDGGEYDISLQLVPLTCPSECSMHGSCNAGSCSCDDGYNGEGCEYMTVPLQFEQTVHGYVDQNYWNYYTGRFPTENNVVVQLTPLSGDCDLYVRDGQDPTKTEYTWLDLSYDNPTELIIESPGSTLWHIGVVGWTECEYELVVLEPDECECKSFDGELHGHCDSDSDICVCDDLWAGDGCDIPATQLDNGDILSSETVSDSARWKYYQITATSSAMLISMKEKESRGFLWLFASTAGFPNLESYDYSSNDSDTDLHEIHIVFKEQSTRTYYIAVYDNPYDITPGETPFEITAWAPPF